MKKIFPQLGEKARFAYYRPLKVERAVVADDFYLEKIYDVKSGMFYAKLYDIRIICRAKK